jgi:hypothetical protein
VLFCTQNDCTEMFRVCGLLQPIVNDERSAFVNFFVKFNTSHVIVNDGTHRSWNKPGRCLIIVSILCVVNRYSQRRLSSMSSSCCRSRLNQSIRIIISYIKVNSAMSVSQTDVPKPNVKHFCTNRYWNITMRAENQSERTQ